MTSNGCEYKVIYKTSDGYTFDNYNEAAAHAIIENKRTSAGCTIEEEKEGYFYGLSQI